MENRPEHVLALKNFLYDQRVAVLATNDIDSGSSWVANIFYAPDEEFKLYFVASAEARFGKNIIADERVSFAISWFNSENHEDRKGIQAEGVCRIAENSEIDAGVNYHNQRFSEFSHRITSDWIRSEDNSSQIWVITPKYIKFWNDELFAPIDTQTFIFDSKEEN